MVLVLVVVLLSILGLVASAEGDLEPMKLPVFLDVVGEEQDVVVVLLFCTD